MEKQIGRSEETGNVSGKSLKLNRLLKIKADIKFLFAAMAISMTLIVGCSSMSSSSRPLQLRLTGDKNVTAHITIGYNGSQQSSAMVSVPSVLELPEKNYEVLCMQGVTPGKLQVNVFRGETDIATAEVDEPGSVIEMVIHDDHVSTTTKSRGAAEKTISKGGSQ